MSSLNRKIVTPVGKWLKLTHFQSQERVEETNDSLLLTMLKGLERLEENLERDLVSVGGLGVANDNVDDVDEGHVDRKFLVVSLNRGLLCF